MPKKADYETDAIEMDVESIVDQMDGDAGAGLADVVQPNHEMLLVPIEDAKQLYELYRNLEAADAHFQTCQSRSFREHIQKVYKAVNVQNAFGALHAQLEALGKGAKGK